MREDVHVRFGGRATETHRPEDRQGAVARPKTEHPTREGKVYCCVVLDTFSRKVVGWSIDSNQTASLVTNALGMAIHNRPRKVLGWQTRLKSSRNSYAHYNSLVLQGPVESKQYTSWAFTKRAKDSGLLPPMGSIGDCFDTQSTIDGEERRNGA
jgi:transposase InsO family protein